MKVTDQIGDASTVNSCKFGERKQIRSAAL
jgi:hypothetical protein